MGEEEELRRRRTWLDSIMGADEWLYQQAQFEVKAPRMHQVPDILRDTVNFDKYYNPSLVSLGPYHHADPKLQTLHNLKPVIARKFVLHIDTDISTLFDRVLEDVGDLRQCYDLAHLTDHDDDEALARMMFLDGCFVLYFIFCVVSNRLQDLGMKNYQIELVSKDLFLLENQIPLQVLKNLAGKHWESYNFAILEYIYFYMNSEPVLWFPAANPLHLLDYLRMIMIGRPSETRKKPPIATRGRVLRNAKELKAKGIYLKPSSTRFLLDLSFSSHGIFGKLALPQMTVDKSTGSIFLNLIAYEMCDNSIDSVVTSYICLLHSLIGHGNDIKVLRSAGVLTNNLCSDEAAAELFNEMAANLVPDVDMYMFVKMKIVDFFGQRAKVKVATWIAEVFHSHFRSPLTVIVFFAATFAICLSVVQTYFTIFPPRDKHD